MTARTEAAYVPASIMDRERSLVPGVLAALRARWRLVLAVPLLSALIGLGLLYLRPNYYTSHAAFIPASRQNTTGLGNLAELAAVAGMSGAMSANPSSPQFYEQLLSTRPIIYGVLAARYQKPARGYDVAAKGDSVPLYELLSDADQTREERLAEAAEELSRKGMATGLDRRTGIVTIDVTLNDPVLAARTASEFIHQVESFNVNTLQTQAHARRVFTQARAQEAANALDAAQDALRRFLQENRQFRDAPTLVFEEDRLRRQVTVNQDLYLSLRRDLDNARIREVDDTPTITVIEPPVVPVKKSGPRRLVIALVIGLLTFAGVSVAVVVADLRRRGSPMLGIR
jgi:uncharacterized protein involved in exopolysaccharide biosynthesis